MPGEIVFGDGGLGMHERCALVRRASPYTKLRVAIAGLDQTATCVIGRKFKAGQVAAGRIGQVAETSGL